MIDYRRLLDRPEKSAQTAAERPIHNTHTHTNTPMQAGRQKTLRQLSHRLLSLTHLHYTAGDL